MTKTELSLPMIARESIRLLMRFEPWRMRRGIAVVVARGRDATAQALGAPLPRLPPPVDDDESAIRITCDGREVRVPLPDGALSWSLDDFAAKVLWLPIMNLTNYDPPLGA